MGQDFLGAVTLLEESWESMPTVKQDQGVGRNRTHKAAPGTENNSPVNTKSRQQEDAAKQISTWTVYGGVTQTRGQLAGGGTVTAKDSREESGEDGERDTDQGRGPSLLPRRVKTRAREEHWNPPKL
jgi:hypothetical protein